MGPNEVVKRVQAALDTGEPEAAVAAIRADRITTLRAAACAVCEGCREGKKLVAPSEFFNSYGHSWGPRGWWLCHASAIHGLIEDV